MLNDQGLVLLMAVFGDYDWCGIEVVESLSVVRLVLSGVKLVGLVKC